MSRLFLFVLVIFSYDLLGQNFWRHVDENMDLSLREVQRDVVPVQYSAFHLDIENIRSYLSKAPEQFNRKGSSLLLYIPMPEGNFMPFDVVYSPVMEPELAARYPMIRSYKGVSRTDENINIRFSIGVTGFYGSIYWPGNNIYIDAYDEGITDYNISYYTRDYTVDLSEHNLSCGVTGNDIVLDEHNHNHEHSEKEINFRETSECGEVMQYNYRFALACTGEWGRRQGGTVESALSAMVISMNRLNQIYENEFAIHFKLINDNDKIIWVDPETDPFENPNSGYSLLGTIGNVINSTVGTSSYDIGHVFTTGCTDVGGVAMLSGVCTLLKASGVTCHYSNNLDYIITNVMAHEVGHQFSAVHTFNNCGGNESNAGFEPGGGNTIMAYCGLCGSNNVQSPCLENFHSFSIQQIMHFSRVGGGRNCAEKIVTENTAPVVNLDYKNGFYIPASTYFVLEGSAYDCEGDELSYSWEQMDTGPRTQIGQPIDGSPLFASKQPSSTPIRYFPDLNSIINNNFNNSEVLPDYSRDMTFRFSARDNHPSAGGSSWAEMNFKVDGDAGPFMITFPQSYKSFGPGEAVEITWDVANTDNEKVNCQYVDIYMSTDFGRTFPHILKYRTPNTGSAIVFMPDTLITLGKFMVKAHDNIFFHMDRFGFRIINPSESTFILDVENTNGVLCNPGILEVDINTRTTGNYSDSVRFEISGLPENTFYQFIPEKINAGENAILHLDFNMSSDDGYFNPVILAISNSGDTLKRDFSWMYNSNSYDNLEILTPLPGESDVKISPTFRWNEPITSESVDFYLSKNPSFPPGETYIVSDLESGLLTPDMLLDYSSVYYWKLEYKNKCGTVPSDQIYTFSTITYKCNEYVSYEVPATINSLGPAVSSVTIDEDMSVSELAVTMRGTHSAFRELRASLIAPDETKALLFNHRSFNYQGNFNLTFNDYASSKVSTPPVGTFLPDETLDIFKNINGKGQWTLEIIDNKSQLSGQLSYFRLYICADVSASAPFMVNNELLKIPLNSYWPISNAELEVSDNLHSDADLIYTIVKTPVFSGIYNNNTRLKAGDKFSQSQINNGDIRIKYDGNENGLYDKFLFTVTNPDGGWIDITEFNFLTDEKVSTEELFQYHVQIYPNPSTDYLNIMIEKEGNYIAEIYDIQGLKHSRHKVSGYFGNTIDISMLKSGIYIIRINNEKHNYNSKIIKL